MGPGLPLSTQLSAALVAFTAESDAEFEHPMTHRRNVGGPSGSAHRPGGGGSTRGAVRPGDPHRAGPPPTIGAMEDGQL